MEKLPCDLELYHLEYIETKLECQNFMVRFVWNPIQGSLISKVSKAACCKMLSLGRWSCNIGQQVVIPRLQQSQNK